MSNCQDTSELLGPWLDGELSRSDGEAVRAHLVECSACREEIRQLERLNVLLKDALAPAGAAIAFPAFWHGLQQRIETARPWAVTALERVRSVFRGPALPWAVPAAILLLIGVVSLQSFWSAWRGRAQNNFAAVESIDAHGRNVALLREDKTKTTVIWLYQEETDDTPEAPASPSF
jgi:anti-sigma factor RsiW